MKKVHLIFDWMTSLCWRGWVWYDGLSRSSSLVTRFGAFINNVIIIFTWRAGSYPPETGFPRPCHCRSWWCPPCWWLHRPDIRAPLEKNLSEIPWLLPPLTLDWEHAELEPLGHGTAPWLELHPEVVTLSWDIKLVFVSDTWCSPVRMTGCWVELQLEKTELDWPLSDRDTVSEAEQSGGRDSL